jgi:hypothetical protein
LGEIRDGVGGRRDAALIGRVDHDDRIRPESCVYTLQAMQIRRNDPRRHE